jgi:hypothetical protein
MITLFAYYAIAKFLHRAKALVCSILNSGRLLNSFSTPARIKSASRIGFNLFMTISLLIFGLSFGRVGPGDQDTWPRSDSARKNSQFKQPGR